MADDDAVIIFSENIIYDENIQETNNILLEELDTYNVTAEKEDITVQEISSISLEELVSITNDENTYVILLDDSNSFGSNVNIEEEIEANNKIQEVLDNKAEEILSDDKLIVSTTLPAQTLLKSPSSMDVFSEVINPSCMQQLNKNNILIKNILKDMKIELKEPIIKNTGPNECAICKKVFVHASGLNRHMEKHMKTVVNINTNIISQQAIAKCLHCGRIFSNSVSAFKHFEEDHQVRNEDSEHDDYFFDDNNNYENVDYKIIKTIEQPNIIQKKVDSTKQIFKEDIIKVIILGHVFQCEFCEFMFCDVENLLKHENLHDPTFGYVCQACDIRVPTVRKILLHWQVDCVFQEILNANKDFCIQLQKYFLCNICFVTFTSIDLLYDHRYTHNHLFPRKCNDTMKLKIICEQCGILFDTAKSLILHYRECHMKHIIMKKEPIVKSRQFLCDVCGKSYTQSSHLWQHLRFHKGVKPFACTVEGCTRRFTIRPDLNDHIRKCHTGERPYQCLVCGKRFLTGSVYYQHRLIHRGERRYGCEQCEKRFYRADALKNHVRIHTGEKPYPCDYCAKAFRQRGDKDKHIRSRHSTMLNNNYGIDKNLINTTKEGNNKGIVYIGNIPFPQSMFTPLLKDIDAI